MLDVMWLEPDADSDEEPDTLYEVANSGFHYRLYEMLLRDRDRDDSLAAAVHLSAPTAPAKPEQQRVPRWYPQMVGL